MFLDDGVNASGIGNRAKLAAFLRQQQGGGGGGGNTLVWSPAGNGDVTTWPQVRAALLATKGPINIRVIDQGGPDYQAGAPGEITDLHGSFFSAPFGDQSSLIVNLHATAQFRNFGLQGAFAGSISGGMRFQTNGMTAVPALDWDPASAGNPYMVIAATAGAMFKNNGSAPSILVPDGLFSVFSQSASGGILLGDLAAPFISLGVASNLLLSSQATAGITLDPTWVASDVGSLLLVSATGFDFGQVSAWAGYAGTIKNVPLDLQGGSGPLALRPSTAFGPLPDGVTYWATDIPPPSAFPYSAIYWSVVANEWVSAVGGPYVPAILSNPLKDLHGNYQRRRQRGRTFKPIQTCGSSTAASSRRRRDSFRSRRGKSQWHLSEPHRRRNQRYFGASDGSSRRRQCVDRDGSRRRRVHAYC